MKDKIRLLPQREQTSRTKREERIVVDEQGVIDMPFLILTILLVGIGVIMMFSASYASAYIQKGSSTFYFARQGLFAIAGIAIMLIVGRVSYRTWYPLALPIFAVTMFLMMLVPLIGVEEGGAKRWLNLGISFQPSEIAKVSLIMMYARLITTSKDRIKTFRGLLPFVGILLVVILLLVLQRHLSAIVIITCVAAAMLFMGGAQLRWFGLGLAGVGLFFLIYLTSMDYAGARVTAWLDPWSDPQDSGYQIIQSLYAIGSGGLMGQGLGRSRQKYLYLPEEHNDYIFPVVCEELGFVGAVLIVLLFMLLILRGFWIAVHAKDRFGALLAAGVTTLLALQVFFNIGVVTNFLPSTGISLPFFSYGGTALLLQLFEMGLVLSVSRQCDNKLLS